MQLTICFLHITEQNLHKLCFYDNFDNVGQLFIIHHSTFIIKKNGSPVAREAVPIIYVCRVESLLVGDVLDTTHRLAVRRRIV